jgi:hypothetical protein
MSMTIKPIEHKFPCDPENQEYCLFPDEMEKDEQIFFHGTAEKNFASIIATGFRISGNLPSISFARNSCLSLKYACECRGDDSPRGVVLAVRYVCLNNQSITQESFGLHVYCFDEQPEIVAYCIIPENYAFL